MQRWVWALGLIVAATALNEPAAADAEQFRFFYDYGPGCG
jgi:hypothetical protein